MVDYHTHILPRMDDGSHSVGDSIKMLTALETQGVDTVCLTSHYYGNREAPERFLERRTKAYDQLCRELPEKVPQLRLGAEVLYYPGISRMTQLPRLRLEGTSLLLLEMPFTRWNQYTVDEVLELQGSGVATVMLAHIERYLAWQKQSTWERLLESGILMQSNAEFFFTPVVRQRAVKMLWQGRVHFLGTDTHNLSTRGPHMDLAFQTIEKKLGTEVAAQVKAESDRLLKECGT